VKATWAARLAFARLQVILTAMRLFTSIMISLAVLAASAHADDKKKQDGPIVHVDAAGAAKLLAEKDPAKRPTVIDIRTTEEFDGGHLADARQIDYLSDDFEAKISKLDRARPYLVHCRSGGRSGRSLDVWKRLGFKKIYHLDGGILAWEKAKQPVVK